MGKVNQLIYLILSKYYLNKSLKKNGDVVNNMAQHEHNNIKCYSSTLRRYI